MSDQQDDRFDRFKEDFGRRLSDAAARKPAGSGRARVAGAVSAVAVLALVFGTAHSTTKTLTAATTATGTAPSIENEAGKSPDEPDQYQDFKDASGQNVTTAQL